MYSLEVCDIKRNTCLILVDTRREWWDQACEDCEKTRVEDRPNIGEWTQHILQLKYELEECRIPYGVDDLSPDEWYFLGIVAQEIKKIDADLKRKQMKKRKDRPAVPG